MNKLERLSWGEQTNGSSLQVYCDPDLCEADIDSLERLVGEPDHFYDPEKGYDREFCFKFNDHVVTLYERWNNWRIGGFDPIVAAQFNTYLQELLSRPNKQTKNEGMTMTNTIADLTWNSDDCIIRRLSTGEPLFYEEDTDEVASLMSFYAFARATKLRTKTTLKALSLLVAETYD